MRCQSRESVNGPKCQLLQEHPGLHANGIVYVEGRGIPSATATIWKVSYRKVAKAAPLSKSKVAEKGT